MKNRLKLFLSAGVVFLTSLGLHAQETNKTASLLVSVGYVSKYMQHGFNIGDDQPNVQLCVYKALPAGFGVAYWSSLPIDRATRRTDTDHFLLLQRHTFFANKFHECAWAGYADYWIDPNRKKNGNTFRGLKFNAGISMPHLLPLPGPDLAPSYNLYAWTPVDNGLFKSGSVHEFMLIYPIPLPDGWKPFHDSQTLDLSVAADYNTGVFGVEPGWSHTAYALQSTFHLKGLQLLTKAYYQNSLEPTINPEDEGYAEISLRRWF